MKTANQRPHNSCYAKRLKKKDAGKWAKNAKRIVSNYVSRKNRPKTPPTKISHQPMTRSQPSAILAPLAFTLIIVGYLTVWLPHPTAGLTLLGIELGEWLQFLPEVAYGQAPVSRNLFYLPPITLGLSIALLTVYWPSRWQTWLMRLLAIAAAWMAFPPIPVILQQDPSKWRLRLGAIVLVIVVAAFGGWLKRLPSWLIAIDIIALGIAGAIIPTYAFLAMRPILSHWYASAINIGPGVYLTALGHLLLILVGITQLRNRPLQA